MPKQIKLGFDKGTSRSKDSDQVLVDVRGNRLEDSKGNFLYTETTSTPNTFFAAKNATSMHVNNEPSETVERGKAIGVVEQFPDLSEVANSLLGIPRLGKQQSLFSDVSVYGLDSSIWEFYSNPQQGDPVEWSTRLNKNYGNRYNPRLNEYANEQALALELFPVPYSFPFGPKWEQDGRYNPILFARYKRFIQLGNALYNYYASDEINLKEFAASHFLVPGVASINAIPTEPDLPGTTTDADSSDVIYNSDFAYALENVEQWTMTWMDIRSDKLKDPRNPGRLLNINSLDRLFKSPAVIARYGNLGFTFSETQPGYSSVNYRYCQLQSKEAFRYQPGAISGFTFGIRLSTDQSTLTNAVEWGCANTTDQFMFQVRGSQFSIVRRSTVKLTPQNLELMGLKEEDQIIVQSPNPFERSNTSYTTTDLGLPPKVVEPIWQIIIRSDKFNADALDGAGPSGYNISFQNVTMYKIEYSWYGAIGAKFYAYVPVGNAECRWVLLHTFIIENTLNNPSLQNPYMHFRYSAYMTSTSSLREPMYVYKYGASYYIDGNDEGTYTYNSYKVPLEKNINSSYSVPVIGFKPKDSILNRDGIPVDNLKNFYIDEMSITSNKNVRVDVLECSGCPDGHGHFYATGLRNGQRGITDEFTIVSGGKLQYTDPTKQFTEFTGFKKIIAPAIHCSYVKYENSVDLLDIRRRLGRFDGTSNSNINIGTSTYTDASQTILRNPITGLNDIIPVIGYTFNGRLTGYDDIVASDVIITKPNISVKFLNPITRESTGQWCEYIIGITDKKPVLTPVTTPEGDTIIQLLFDGAPLDLENETYAEFAPFAPSRTLDGIESGEADVRTGITLQQDFRVTIPKGVASGYCSELNFSIKNIPVTNVSYSTTDPSGSLFGSHFIIFQQPPAVIKLSGNDIGVLGINGYITSGIVFTSDIVEYTETPPDSTIEVTRYIVSISGDISGSNIAVNGIALRTIRCFGRYIDKTSIINFGATEYYLFVAMRDNARINNIVVKEFDEFSAFSHTPNWIKDEYSNIQLVDVENAPPPPDVRDIRDPDVNEYINDGAFYMGGFSTIGNLPANFTEKTRLASVTYDPQLDLPLRPATLKSSVYIGANTSESLDMKHLFGSDRYKLSKGSLNNQLVYLSSIVTEEEQIGEEPGVIFVNITSKEQ